MGAKRSITSLYLKIFLFSGIVFGALMGLFFLANAYAETRSMAMALATGVVLGIIVGALFGLAMALFIGTLHILAIRSKKYPITDETIGVRHAREIKTDAPPAEALKLCESSLDTVKGSRIVSEDKDAGRVEARTPLSWKSWGEKLSCEVRGEAGGGSTIRVSSRPAVKFTIADYGKNLINVEEIARYIRGRSARPGE